MTTTVSKETRGVLKSLYQCMLALNGGAAPILGRNTIVGPIAQLYGTYYERAWRRLADKLQKDGWTQEQIRDEISARTIVDLNPACPRELMLAIDAWYKEAQTAGPAGLTSLVPGVQEKIRGILKSYGVDPAGPPTWLLSKGQRERT